ncbi:alkaline phosphatase family protein [Actinoallomurus rhizosphaericola]|uniref:alkaline phosphatase family protein n=1 Tax=Actinoallomurus rhizosphaericola TaxID=2952536 RepID=UPI0020933B42|nr:alkaline phosphatase family protein [Actinoallomurus rhizosphaericola]MCO5998029.1 alkaline phosphatase family protein [Actinoallomurus rhizosphaericola]
MKDRRFRRALLLAATLLAASPAAGCGDGGATHAAGPHPTAASVPQPAHVVVVVLENKSDRQIVGARDAPYLTSLARSGALFTNSYAVRHPSQPNYLALFSGSTQGLTDDSCPHTYTAPNLASELSAAGLTFAGFAEALPAFDRTACVTGNYARKHVPWADFPDLPDAVSRSFADFPSDYSALPTVSFVIPDMCDDMHNCPVKTGDAWVRENLDGYAQWARTHDSLLIVTFDENDNRPGNKIATIFAGGPVKPGTYPEKVDHYRVLRTIEDAYGLPHAGESAARSPITDAWRT